MKELHQLAQAYLEAKQAEAAAIAARREIGKLLEAAMPGPDEGTVHLTDGSFKITVSRKMTRKVDTDRLQLMWDNLPTVVRDTFKWSAGLNLKHYRALQEVGNEFLAEANQFITSTPAAASVDVELDTKI